MRRDRFRKQPWRPRVALAPLAAMAMVSSMGLPATGTGAGDGSLGSDRLDGGAENPPEDAVAPAAHEQYQVTLITGDVVQWEVSPDGYGTATVDSRDRVEYQTIESGDDYYVIPSDVTPLLDATLDRELFNVTALIDQGYHDDAVNGVPVIITGDRLTGADAIPGLTVERSLSAIAGVSGYIAHDDTEAFGAALALNASPAGVLSARGSIDKVWLDQQVQVRLEDSVPQTGAPQAWEAGFDGTGTTIAVLDTGIDETHADIGDKVIAAENFTSANGTGDGHGHGTHVAATAAGTGDASDGLRPGVAPGASLVNAKVLDDEGNGTTSGIIAGMEWAAAQDVDVINMSLGGGTTDGTDPLSQAVNTLTDEHDVLFVIASGNDGPSMGTVEAPGTADAALTVGAVDKSGELAPFSGRGPRVGDFAIKPDITAPGMWIVAARAAGTSMGSPVDDDYTTSHGTSMAAPHVAGAVAILAQQRPDWGPATLKSALVNSATPHEALTVYEQGGGELDVAKAIETTVITTPSTLNLGYFDYPHDDEVVTEMVTYTNLGTEPVTLDLALTLVDEDAAAAPEGMVTFDPATVTVQPGASEQVEITVDSALGHLSLYSGAMIATDSDGDEVISTPAGLYKEGEKYDITVEGIQHNGLPADRGSSIDVIALDGMADIFETGLAFVDGTATLRVPPGSYSVMGMVTTVNQDDPDDYLAQLLMGEPELEVTEDVHLVWDSREGLEVTVETPYETTTEFHSIHYHRSGGAAGDGYTHTWNGYGDWPYYTAPTEPVTSGTFAFASKYEMSAPDGVWLDLLFGEHDAIPHDLAYQANDDTTAAVSTAYHSAIPGHELGRTHSAWRPYQTVAFNVVREVAAPQVRLEYVMADDSRWQKRVNAAAPTIGGITEPMTHYEPGAQLEQSWFASPSVPSLDEGNEHFDGPLPSRNGDLLNLFWTYEWGDANGDVRHFGEQHSSVDSTAFRLYQDGELSAEAPRALGEFEVAPGDSRLRLELDVARQAEWWTTSTQTSTAWEFDSTTTDADTPLPLLLIDYDLGLNLSNELDDPFGERGRVAVSFEVRHPAGVDGADIEDAELWLSYDDGQTWSPRPVVHLGDGVFTADVDRYGDGSHASLRVEAWDASGSRIEQEVTRAYVLAQP